MKFNFSKLFNNDSVLNTASSDLESLKELIVSNGLELSQCKYALILSVYCPHCIDLLPEIKKVEELFNKNKIILIIDSTKQELDDILSYFTFEFSTITVDYDYMLENLNINKTPSLFSWDIDYTCLEKNEIANISDVKKIILGESHDN